MIIRIISSILAMAISSIIMAQIVPIFRRKEIEQNALAERAKKVFLSKTLYWIFLVLLVFVWIIEIALICFPDICGVLGVDYAVVLILWAIPSLFSSVMFLLLSKEVIYDENGFTVRNAFGARKAYSYVEIVLVEKKGNLKIKTKTGNILLFNALYGVDAFYAFIKEKLEVSFL